MAKIIFTEEPFAGRTFEFSAKKTTVGRQAQNDLVIHHDSISHSHCEIHVNGPEVIIRDLGSKNGTFVDGHRLKNSQSQLKHGQIVCFGSVKARLDLEELDDDSDTAMTAIGLFDKYKDSGRKPQKDTDKKSGPELELGAGGDDEDQTVFMKGGRPEVPKYDIPKEEPSEIPGQKFGGKIIIAVVVVVILGMVIFLAFRG